MHSSIQLKKDGTVAANDSSVLFLCPLSQQNIASFAVQHGIFHSTTWNEISGFA